MQVIDALKAVPETLNTARHLIQNDLVPFIGPSQREVLAGLLRGEERNWFAETLVELQARIANMPKSYEQDGKGDDAIVYLHYFVAGADWYITEKDMEDGVSQAFGWADLRFDTGELGYISITEALSVGAEIDLHWKPKTLGEVKKKA